MSVVTRKSLFSAADLIPALPIVSIREGENIAHIAADAEKDAGRGSLPTSFSLSSAASATESEGIAQLSLDGSRVSSSFLCSTCAVAFDTAEELRDHAKSAWHIHNIQQTTQNKPNITEEQHAQLTLHITGLRPQPTATPIADGQEPVSPFSSASSSDEDLTAALPVPIAEEEKEEEPALSGSSRIIFSTPTQRIHVWKSLLSHPRFTSSSSPFSTRSALYLSSFRALPSLRQIAVFLCVGGRFAAAVFSSSSPILHRSFVRYTTRKKQGGSQASSDNAAGSGHQARSIGSSIRRKEMMRFVQQVHDVMGEWKAELDRCQLLFLFAPSVNRRIFFHSAVTAVRDAGGSMIERDVSWRKDDGRVRGVPFSVYKPTFAEVQRVYKQLTTLEFVDRTEGDEEQDKPSAPSAAKEAVANGNEMAAPSRPPSAPPEPDLVLAAIDADDLPQLQQVFASQYQRPVPPGGAAAVISPVYHACVQQRLSLLPFLVSSTGGHQDINEQTITSLPSSSSPVCWSALHFACASLRPQLVTQLLDLGADPTRRDSRGLTPYAAVPGGVEGKEVRAMMRRWAGEKGEGKWDWSSAGFVPTRVLTEEEEEERRRVVREKEKEKKARQKARQKEKKEEEKKLAEREAEERKRKAEAEAEQKRKADEDRKAALVMEQAWEARERTLEGMSDRERRAMAAERRIQAMKGGTAGGAAKCDACGKPLVRVPFERLHYKYDTLLCLQNHRAELEKQQQQRQKVK